jgi:hypothetical protein
MEKLRFYIKLEEFRISFLEVTELDIPIKKFLNIIETFTNIKEPDLYMIDYSKLHQYILTKNF